MLWEVEIQPAAGLPDREAERVLADSQGFGADSVRTVRSAKSFLIEGDLDEAAISSAAEGLLVDGVIETWTARRIDGEPNPHPTPTENTHLVLNVLFKPGVTDNVALTAKTALEKRGLQAEAVATCRKYRLNQDATQVDLERLATKVLSNEAIERVIWGPLSMKAISLGSPYQFELIHVPIRTMDDAGLENLSKTGQLYLNLTEMQTIRQHYIEQDRDPTDVELETLAQTWSEHCSHKTLAGRIRYRDDEREIQFENMLKETIFAATVTIREELGDEDWCVSVFKDNAGIVKFDDTQNVCFKVETHNHPSALEPYGGANTGLGGVIRDPLGTGLGAKPICNTDVFCFAPPDTSYEDLPPGVLHPKIVARGVVSGVRDYGNRMGLPTVNGAVYFDSRYLGNPLVYCGNVGMIPVDKCEKNLSPGDLIVAVGGRTGRDGIHGATFSSAELTEESETLSGGAVQIGNAVTEKMVLDVLLAARDRGLYSSITDCGAGGFSSAVGEMGEHTGAEVWLDKAPLKYAGLSYAEIWISEAQERMVLAVPPANWEEFQALCQSEDVEATVIGEFTETQRLVLKYQDTTVADLAMEFLHDGRPPVIRQAVYSAPESQSLTPPTKDQYDEDLKAILGSLNVCSKEWIIRQYDHEVLAGSVIKPLVGAASDGPSDAAVIRPDFQSTRGLVISCGMNPRLGDFDPYWMAASAIDEALRNCIAVGADPNRIAILDNFCWGNTDKPETLGSLVRAALACQDVAVALRTPFISGKDSLYNEFSYVDKEGNRQTVAIPPSLLISALGQIEDIELAITMDLKSAGNQLFLIGATKEELGGSHWALVNGLTGGQVPQVDLEMAPQIFAAMHGAIRSGWIRSCHDLSEGGLAVALAEMAFAGELGIDVSLKALAESTDISHDGVLMFSESNTRFVIEVPPDCVASVTHQFAGLPMVELGTITEDPQMKIAGTNGQIILDSPGSELKAVWQKPLNWD